MIFGSKLIFAFIRFAANTSRAVISVSELIKVTNSLKGHTMVKSYSAKNLLGSSAGDSNFENNNFYSHLTII